MDTFEDRLAWAIENSPLKQRQIAERLGVGYTRVSHWKNKREIPTLAILLAMPDVLGVDGHWLLTGEGEMRRSREGEAEWRISLVREALERPYPEAADPGDSLPVLDPVTPLEGRQQGRRHPEGDSA